MLFPETLEPHTADVLSRVGQQELIHTDAWYLAGGTALALQLGHRRSVDLDFFAPHNPSSTLRELARSMGTFETVNEDQGTYDGVLDGVKISFIRFRYPLLRETVSYGAVSLADPADIASMKLSAIASRGSKKDFIDLFVLLERFSLQEMIGFFEKKYADANYSVAHLLKSIVYFGDAEHEPMPVLLRPLSWDEVKARLQKEAIALV